MRSYRIGSLFGIPIKLDLTFLLVLPLFAYLIGEQVEDTVGILNGLWGSSIPVAPLTDGVMPWIVGIAAAVSLFVGVVLHELGHSLTARSYGYSIDSITLWIFGGIASFAEMPEDWRQELAISIAGPVVSVLVGIACFVGFLVVPGDLPAVQFVLGYLALLNLSLAVFNMLPGFPMDGGRVLRALLARTRPYARATEIAAEVGKGFAVLLGIVGLFTFQWLLIGIAFFIYIGASSEAKQVMLKSTFQGVTVADVMTHADDLHTVASDASVADLLERMFRERHTGYPVVENDRLVGLVTLDDAKEIDPVERDAFTVEDVMTTDLVTVDVDDGAMDALSEMQDGGIGRLLVTDRDGDLVGLVTRSDLMTAFDVIQSSGSLDASERVGAA